MDINQLLQMENSWMNDLIEKKVTEIVEKKFSENLESSMKEKVSKMIEEQVDDYIENNAMQEIERKINNEVEDKISEIDFDHEVTCVLDDYDLSDKVKEELKEVLGSMIKNI